METTTKEEVRQEFIPAGEEILESKTYDIVTFKPAADWNNAMLGAFKKAVNQSDAPIERIRELIALQREIQQENAKLEFNAAMSRVQQKIQPVTKNKYNSQTQSWYADLHEICNMVTPIYSAEGFSVSYGTEVVPDKSDWVRTIATIAHIAGYEKVFPLDLPMDNKGIKDGANKTAVHGIKSSHSYARNILITMIFNIAQKDADDDGNAAGGSVSKKEQKPLISDEQHSRLIDLLADKNLSPKWLTGKMRVVDLMYLELDRYDMAVKAIAEQKAQPAPPIQ